MLQFSTLLIVGAGASAEFQFPVGTELLATIKQLCMIEYDSLGRMTGNQQFISVLQYYAENGKVDLIAVLAAVSSLQLRLQGTRKSIDQLIYTFKEDKIFVDVAKIAIAFAISEREHNAFHLTPEVPWSQTPWMKDNWIDVFTSSYLNGFDRNFLEGIFNDLAIISFNYDRCVEYGFARALAFQLGLADEKTIELASRLKVIHPYGSLGALPTSRHQIELQLKYRQSPEEICKMAKNIRTFTEGVEHEGVAKKITEAIDSATLVIALGFGFQSQNVQLLKANSSSTRYLAGTVYAMSNSDRTTGPERLKSSLRATELDQFAMEPAKSFEFLNSHQLAIF